MTPPDGCSAGRLVYVVGPSGAGKDSVIAWARAHLPAGANIEFARRVIVRPVQADAEQHEAVDADAFAARLARGEFALHWRANGTSYGIGCGIRASLARGACVVVNGSREHVPLARTAFPQLELVHVTAPQRLLGERLAARDREPADQVVARLERNAHPGCQVEGADLEIVNDGELARAGATLARYLLRPPPG